LWDEIHHEGRLDYLTQEETQRLKKTLVILAAFQALFDHPNHVGMRGGGSGGGVRRRRRRNRRMGSSSRSSSNVVVVVVVVVVVGGG